MNGRLFKVTLSNNGDFFCFATSFDKAGVKVIDYYNQNLKDEAEDDDEPIYVLNVEFLSDLLIE